MKNEILDRLVSWGHITHYELRFRDENGKIVPEQKGFRNTEELVIVLPSGVSLVVGTFCSGSAENTVLDISLDSEESLQYDVLPVVETT